MGSWQVASLGEAVAKRGIGLVVMDAPVSPVQQHNLEQAWNCKVIKRTGLILDLFGERARMRERALQVELAHLLYQRSQLVRSWIHLGRQRGGIGRVAARRGVIMVSTQTGEGVPALREALDTRLSEGLVTAGYDLPTSDGAHLAWFYGHDEVMGRQDRDEAIHVTVRLFPGDRAPQRHGA
jgi:50S ribosomal subunit-associated GTPase HflX